LKKNGSVTNVKPVKCLGAGCESEAVRVVSMSPKWKNGTLYSQPSKFQYVVPVSFSLNHPKKPTYIESLKKSDYGFVFFIKHAIYNIDEVKAILGKSFDPANIESVENYDNPKYAMPDKKAVYLVVMKNS
jgi:protein TonB